MANTIRVPKAYLILALCLPLAVLIGFFLAQGPTDLSGLAVVALVLGGLSTPLLIKYHHPLLLLAWNAALGLFFLQGQPSCGMIMAFVSLLASVFHRAIDADKRFLTCRSLTAPLLFLGAVVGVTAMLTGGIGFRSLGSSQYGGRFYLELAAAFAGFFALTSQRIPPERAGLYVGLFFLSALTGVLGNLIYLAGPPFYFLFAVVSSGGAYDQATAAAADWGALARFGSFAPAALGLLYWLLARYGLRGTLDYTKPWRLMGFLLAFLGCLLSGFRISFVFFLVLCFCMFTLEGLWRTRAVPILVLLVLGSLAIALPQSEKLPPAVQRCISFLPVKVDPTVAEDARHSTEWRLDMWRSLYPQIPQYLLKGKGYTIDASDLARAAAASTSSFGISQETSAVAMEYHNGALSVLIPFGILGMAGFLWFLAAGLRVLYCNYRFGDPTLRLINTLLLGAFATKALFFFVAFGALHSELFAFTGFLGLSISLNGGIRQPTAAPAPAEAPALEAA